MQRYVALQHSITSTGPVIPLHRRQHNHLASPNTPDTTRVNLLYTCYTPTPILGVGIVCPTILITAAWKNHIVIKRFICVMFACRLPDTSDHHHHRLTRECHANVVLFKQKFSSNQSYMWINQWTVERIHYSNTMLYYEPNNLQDMNTNTYQLLLRTALST